MAAWPPEWIRQALNTVLTTTGDIAYRASTGVTRLAIGTTNYTLAVVAGVPAWIPSPTSVLTATGDILYASAANTLARLAIGSTHHVLTVAGGVPTWAAGSKATLTTTGDRLVASSANTLARLPIGTVALSVVEGTPDTCAVDLAAGTAFTATLDEATTFSWSNETYGWQSWVLKLTTSGTVAEPTWPAGMTRIGSGAWVTTTATVNYVHVFRLATGTYIYTVAQAA